MNRKKARVHSLEFKNKVLDEIERGELTSTEALKKYKLASSVLSKWKTKRAAGTLSSSSERAAPARSNTPADVKRAALAELAAGGNAKAIAKRLGVSAAAVYWWKNHGFDGKPGERHNGKTNGKTAVVVAEPVNGSHRVPQIAAQAAMRDATIFLRKAKAELMSGIRDGSIDDLDSTHLLSLLALRSLQGA